MAFLQIKPNYCDYLLLVGVFLDDMLYWLIPSEDLKNGKVKLTNQHRDGKECQIHIRRSNISKFDKYRIELSELTEKIG